MAASVDSSGEIEVTCFPIGPVQRMRVFDRVTIGDRLALVFTPIDEMNPPYQLKITSPSGANILDTIIRDLPTGLPQSPPPVEFVVSARGVYRVEIREMRGRQRGEASVKIS
jgi:hypothetical protein